MYAWNAKMFEKAKASFDYLGFFSNFRRRRHPVHSPEASKP